jgi:hypothetical protein
MKTRTHFAHRIDMVDADGKIQEHLADVEDLSTPCAWSCRNAGSTRRNARGIDALKLYRAEYDDKLQALRPQPVHDWTSHAATRSATSRSPSTARRRKPVSIALSSIRSWGWCERDANSP